jgi:opacity protein-like surface antigen
MAALVITLMIGATAWAQQTPPPAPEPEEKVIGGYVTHQSLELGGHIVDQSGSGPMYDTLVNVHSGPRILNQSLTMRAKDLSHATFFDNLSTSSFGYGGDPINGTVLNVSKGHLYDFRGSFRRNRQYFDYNLLANPLIPPNSNPFVPALYSPHLYNTVRRVLDLNLTLFPISRFSARVGYNHNINQGPSYSTIHVGTDALLLQNWRNSTDTWTAGVDWKPDSRTTLSYDQFITHYKGDTNWQLAGLNYQLSNGTPVSLGVNLSSVWGTPCSAPFNSNGTVNPTCNAYLAYQRYAPTRTLFPTEQFRFQSSSIRNVTMNGRLLYNGTTSNLTNFYELFNGFSSRGTVRQTVQTGSAHVQRVNVNGDFGVTWKITPTIAVSDVYDYWYFRQPGTNQFSETDYTGSSMLVPPGNPTTTTTTDYQFLNQKTNANTLSAAWDVTPRARLSLGYRYRSRTITQLANLTEIHENWGLFGAALRPTPQLRINFNFDGMYADNAFTRISPRQLQHYLVRTTYQPHPWLTLSGTANIFESRNNVTTVNHLEHNHEFSFGASIAPGEKWSLDLSYGYNDVYSTTILCYASTPPPPNAGAAPPICVGAGTPYLSNGYYDQPTQYGSFGVVSSPLKRFHLNAGYRISAVNGSTTTMNIRQVNGSLQSYFQTPYAGVAWDLEPQWTWKADYNFYGYGEGLPVGQTLPRNFHGNVVTLAVRYAF